MTARRTRRRSAAYAALALGLAGSLALTGCNGSAKSKKSSSSSSSKSTKRKIIGGGTAAAGAGAGAAATRRTPPCPVSTTRLSFSQPSGPKGYVSVRYRNASSTLSCVLYDGPLLYFSKSKSPVPLMKGEGGNVLTLRPKGVAYAVIPTTTPAARGTEHKEVGVQFPGGHLGSRTPDQPLPYDLAKKYSTVSVGQSQITYWYGLLSTAKRQAGVGN
ncbi:hypothetical protein ADL22_25865 [Streptomyces sp. NRRL F-4489]|uniref:DUF4232 domain-containing protein n=1 Tax=Streptomyces sp. NRRL F-4489 TaxID=1609095 RepID=UPI0007475C23|nr:DUF4232 domain-containing protein [Streptomyces sp. NRRL F-4489]KUL35996.1 hypothetical protein ADL22_25865 [Streptomyces sp. NRRL F-4489]